jgi:hypothetical protein
MTKAPKPMSVENANNTLVLVRSIVDDLTRTWAQISAKLTQLSEMRAAEIEDVKSMLQTTMEIDKLAGVLNGHVDELEEIGCCVESFDKGIIDFPSKIDGDPVMLCWSSDDSEISYYHKLGETTDKRLLIKHIVE